MFIHTYKYQGVTPHDQWSFDEFQLDTTNLLVGKTGSGKTRFLNTLFNLGRYTSVDEVRSWSRWDIVFTHEDQRFVYRLGSGDKEIYEETLDLVKGDSKERIIERNRDSFTFKGSKLPRLDSSKTGISLLKEESIVEMAHRGFGSIMRRRFDTDVLERNRHYGTISKTLIDKIKKEGLQLKSMVDLPLSTRLYLIKENEPQIAKRIFDFFFDVFPDFTKWKIRQLRPDEVTFEIEGSTPGIFLTEKQVTQPVSAVDLSSGMEKVLLIITDILTAPNGTVYIIDEYENSLGVNAIDFLPELLTEVPSVQTIITTHHPYLINAMPVRNWQILSRRGSKVSVVNGSEREGIYKASSQEAFIQLLNDPMYATESLE